MGLTHKHVHRNLVLQISPPRCCAVRARRVEAAHRCPPPALNPYIPMRRCFQLQAGIGVSRKIAIHGCKRNTPAFAGGEPTQGGAERLQYQMRPIPPHGNARGLQYRVCRHAWRGRDTPIRAALQIASDSGEQALFRYPFTHKRCAEGPWAARRGAHPRLSAHRALAGPRFPQVVQWLPHW